VPQKGGLGRARLAVGVAYLLVILAGVGIFAYAAVAKAGPKQRPPVASHSQAPLGDSPPSPPLPDGTPSAAATATPDPVATPAPQPVVNPPPSLPTPTPANPPPVAPAHFGTLGPGAALPSGAQCAAWVHALPMAENKRVNAAANQVTGHGVGTDLFSGDVASANQVIAPRIDGRFMGTTHEVLRWAACKWGVDEDLVAAQAAVESWWRQTTLGDFGTDPSRCPPGHGLGVDGEPGKCPESYGVLQNRYPYERSTWPGIGSSTAMNADTAYAIWRACFEGYEQWLNTVDRGSQYSAGDALGCVGRWFSGRWHTAASDGYVAKVQGYLSGRVWETADFQEP
jgi:hypothetical protein